MPEDNEMDELDAMRTVATAIIPLPEDARMRVLRWAVEKYGGQAIKDVRSKSMHESAKSAGGSTEVERSFESAAELMAVAEPQTEAEKVMVISYWFQVVLGQSDLESQAINTELKHQGHGVKNITVAFNALMTQRPQLVIQLRKSGNSRQARKKYKLTTEGISRVNQMLSGSRGDSNDD